MTNNNKNDYNKAMHAAVVILWLCFACVATAALATILTPDFVANVLQKIGW